MEFIDFNIRLAEISENIYRKYYTGTYGLTQIQKEDFFEKFNRDLMDTAPDTVFTIMTKVKDIKRSANSFVIYTHTDYQNLGINSFSINNENFNPRLLNISDNLLLRFNLSNLKIHWGPIYEILPNTYDLQFDASCSMDNIFADPSFILSLIQSFKQKISHFNELPTKLFFKTWFFDDIIGSTNKNTEEYHRRVSIKSKMKHELGFLEKTLETSKKLFI